MAATAINGIRHSKSGAKAGLVADGGFDADWRERRLVQSAAKPNMQRKTNPPEPDRGDGKRRITPNYPTIAFEIFRGKRWASLRSAPTYDLAQHTKLNHI
ncbi:hypothetical protein [Aeromonas dhakensis]|uniref:hypothetical protein n=1 Tax=Aeromonas dhakensis TaxID=196024 RepID=UPI0012E7FE25|nr:hypothetical protein [Aeromonas dhakensis]